MRMWKKAVARVAAGVVKKLYPQCDGELPRAEAERRAREEPAEWRPA